MFSIDHLGIAVKSLAQAKKFYEGLGMNIMPEEEVAAERVKLAMVPVGESRIELLEPTSDDSPIARFLANALYSLRLLSKSSERAVADDVVTVTLRALD